MQSGSPESKHLISKEPACIYVRICNFKNRSVTVDPLHYAFSVPTLVSPVLQNMKQSVKSVYSCKKNPKKTKKRWHVCGVRASLCRFSQA